MAFLINDECINCGACETECPNNAISPVDDRYIVDNDQCTECVGSFDESQCASVCPVDACIIDPDFNETHEDLLEKHESIING